MVRYDVLYLDYVQVRRAGSRCGVVGYIARDLLCRIPDVSRRGPIVPLLCLRYASGPATSKMSSVRWPMPCVADWGPMPCVADWGFIRPRVAIKLCIWILGPSLMEMMTLSASAIPHERSASLLCGCRYLLLLAMERVADIDVPQMDRVARAHTHTHTRCCVATAAIA